jgi:hypothetical protein
MKIRLYEKEKKERKKSEFQISLCAACSVDFESKNYTILTSRCTGPRFPPLACCNVLKDFACTYADAINDMTADCTAIMFSYMDLYGGYPSKLSHPPINAIDLSIMHRVTYSYRGSTRLLARLVYIYILK